MIPHHKSLDSSLALLADPYRFVGRTADRLGTDVFETRLLFRPTLCLRGPEGARLFYDNDKFIRHGAFPKAVRRTLIGEGGVQTVDDAEHRARKQLFLSLLRDHPLDGLTRLFSEEWRQAATGWTSRDEVVLYEALHPMLTRAVCTWAGVPLTDDDLPRRAHQLRSLFDHAGAKGPQHLGARLARKQAEQWIAELVTKARAGVLPIDDGSPFAAFVRFEGPSGRLAPRIAAVEILNILRPTVAVAVYIVFVAHALAAFPEAAPRTADEDTCFLQEVRRFYPFFPAAMALARRRFEWNGTIIPEGRQVMLDLHATNHHRPTWGDPERFRPDRFAGGAPDPYALVPQGGGDHATGHRCPGEWITLGLMRESLRWLREGMRYELPAQDLSIDMKRLPALPGSRMVLRAIRLR